MSNENCPFDVVAVLNQKIREAEQDGKTNAVGMRQALAAVAELVAADREYDEARNVWEAMDLAGAIGACFDARDYDGPEYERLRTATKRRATALAAFGGSDE